MVRRSVSKQTTVRKTVVQQKPVTRQETVVQQRAIKRKEAAVQKGIAAQKPTTGFAIREGMKLGEIEDLSPKFVKMDVPKRPLGDGAEHKVTKPVAKDEVKEVKSKKLIGRFRNKTTKTAAKTSASTEKKIERKEDTFVAPKPAFINQDKVAKRPLSKNVYQKNIVATDEKTNKGPVAIITKPEKESKAGLIVAIILTIILGAVAGTIAFLILPK